MGAINPSKMPKAKKVTRKDGDKVSVFAAGGPAKSSAWKQAINNPTTNWSSKNAVNRKMGYGKANKLG